MGGGGGPRERCSFPWELVLLRVMTFFRRIHCPMGGEGMAGRARLRCLYWIAVKTSPFASRSVHEIRGFGDHVMKQLHSLLVDCRHPT